MLLETRQDIKIRILTSLSKLWGYQGTESEEVFDPIIQILINAIAGELERISGESYTTHLRLADRLAALLVPGVATNAMPAHAVIIATPTEKNEIIDQNHDFLFRMSQIIHDQSREKAKELHFSPTSLFQLHKTEIRFLVVKDQLLKINKRYREPLYESKQRLPNSQLWIGITTTLLENEFYVKNLRFYFECEDKEKQSYFEYYLHQSEWFIENTKIETKVGYENDICGESLNLSGIRSGEYSEIQKQLEEVNQYYKNKFITIKEFACESIKALIPQELAHIVSEKEQKEPILWLKIQFYETISDDLLKRVNVYVNAFPIVNRKNIERSSKMEFMLNIIPLQDEDNFWGLEEVIDSDGDFFRINDISEKETISKSAIIRHEGVGRLDQRSAVTQVQNLVNTIKDERASFAKIDSETLTKDLKDLTALLNRIHEKIENSGDVQDSAYIMIKNKKESSKGKDVFVKFWSTAGDLGNGIPVGTQLVTSKGINLVNKEGLLITSTLGGRNKANREEMLNRMRKQWLTRNRIVTNQDIINACLEHFGENINKVTIKKGIGHDMGTKAGLTRTLDIFITPTPSQTLTESEWDYLKTSFHELLKTNSSNAFAYRIYG